MAIPAVLAGAIANKIDVLAETTVKGIGTFLDGINNIINPREEIPPMVGSCSADYTKLALSAIVASQNTALAYVKKETETSAFLTAEEKKELRKEIEQVELARGAMLVSHSKKAELARKNAQIANVRPTADDAEAFRTYLKKISSIQNTQQVILKLYSQAQSGQLQLNNLGWTFKGLLKSIVSGVGKLFGYVDKAKQIYEKAKPFVENL